MNRRVFTPTDTTDYRSVVIPETVNVAQANPTVTVNPVSITASGSLLDNYQLSGTAMFTVGGSMVSVPGAFAYVAAGSVATIGDGQTEAVTFTPSDTTDYATVSTSVTVNDDAAQDYAASQRQSGQYWLWNSAGEFPAHWQRDIRRRRQHHQRAGGVYVYE